MPGSIAVEQHGNVLIATVCNPPSALMDDAIISGVCSRSRIAPTRIPPSARWY